ncbi:MAG: HesA/MoeB/ThiF family protein [Syntrophales bacterium]
MITDTEKERYDRHIRIEEIGIEGQEKLKNSKVLISGAGGLGSPIAIYLAAAGVGSLRIVDQDKVCLNNLNRQILYETGDIDRKKAESAKESLERLNPDIQVKAIVGSITEDNVFDMAEGCDIILDAMDNFPARYLLNDTALKKNIPFIYGGVYGLEGALTTIVPGETACLRCIFPEVPHPAATVPVLGVTTAVIGSLQAMEAIKYIVGIGKLLANRLLIFDGFSATFQEITLKRNPGCPSCASA